MKDFTRPFNNIYLIDKAIKAIHKTHFSTVLSLRVCASLFVKNQITRFHIFQRGQENSHLNHKISIFTTANDFVDFKHIQTFSFNKKY